MNTNDILERAGAYLELHGLEGPDDESRQMGNVRYLKGLIERHLSAMENSDAGRRDLLGSEIDSAANELQKLLT